MPLVSVVMSVLDGTKVVRTSIDSILAQTIPDFEFIIVDDGSSDGSTDVLENYDDPRIKLINNRERQGLARSLNKAIGLAQGDYLARMDADDVSHPTRFERQLLEFSRSPSLGVIGCNITAIDGAKRSLWRYPERSSEIAMQLLFANAIAHPTVMMKRDVITRHGPLYDEQYDFAQDYELWTRLARCVEFRNIQEALVDYRFTTTNLEKASRQEALARRIRLSYLRRCGVSPAKIDGDSHHRLSEFHPPDSLVGLYHLHRWAKLLPRLTGDVNWTRAELEEEIRRRWKEMFYRKKFRNWIKKRIVAMRERR